MRMERVFADAASQVAKFAGRPSVFILACLLVVVWGVLGPPMHGSDTWQLVMNTISSVITFLMVFLLQNTQARDSEAMHAKLDALIAALDNADHRYLKIERLPDTDIEHIRERYGPKPEDPEG